LLYVLNLVSSEIGNHLQKPFFAAKTGLVTGWMPLQSPSRHPRTTKITLECGPMPNVMGALPNIGGTLVQRRNVWLMPTTGLACSNASQCDSR